MRVDPQRYAESEAPMSHCVTGIYVRAQLPDGQYGTVDLFALDRQSLIAWLGEQRQRPQATVLLLLGYEP